MKNFFIFFVIITALPLFGQNENEFSKVIEVEGATAEQLFLNANYWLIYQNDIQDEIKKDYEGKTLSTSNLLGLTEMESGLFLEINRYRHIIYDIKIEVKEGRYKYTFSNFYVIKLGNIEYDLCNTDKVIKNQKKREKICENMDRIIVNHCKLMELDLINFMKNEITSNDPLNDLPNGIVYELGYDVDDVSKKELYQKVKKWFNKFYSNSNEILTIDDEAAGDFFAWASIPYQSKLIISNDNSIGIIEYTIRVQVRDGGYHYRLSNFVHWSDPYNEELRSYGLITTDERCYEPDNKFVIQSFKRKICKEIHKLLDEEVEVITASLHSTILETVTKEDEFVEEIVPEGRLVYQGILKAQSDNEKALKMQVANWLKKWIFRPQNSPLNENMVEFYGAGEIPYKPPLLKGGLTSTGVILFDISIKLKAGKCKYIFSNFEHRANGMIEAPINYGKISTDDLCISNTNIVISKKKKIKFCEMLKESIDTYCEDMIASLKVELNQKESSW